MPSWIKGSWERINDKDGTKTYEFWQDDYTGLGFSLQEKDTVFKKILSVVNLRDTLFLQVTGMNETPTFFKFTQQNDTSFVCENPANEFPKKILYWIANKQLKAQVSSEQFSIDFVFQKITD